MHFAAVRVFAFVRRADLLRLLGHVDLLLNSRPRWVRRKLGREPKMAFEPVERFTGWDSTLIFGVLRRILL